MGSNTEGEQGYNTIIGYNASLQNYTDVKIPSRCVKFGATYDSGHYQEVSGKEYASNIETLEFSSTVKVINGAKFGESRGSGNGYGFSSLKSVIIPDSVIKIGSNAFADCQKLENIIISENLIEFGNYVFEYTKWYDNQPDGLVYIGNVLYKYKGTMPANTSINIREGTRVIAGAALSGSWNYTTINNLKSVTMPDSVVSIGESAFSVCQNLTNFEMSKNIQYIGDAAFAECSNLESIVIWKNVETLGFRTFDSWRDLQHINIETEKIPATWNDDWNYKCNANIVYAYSDI